MVLARFVSRLLRRRQEVEGGLGEAECKHEWRDTNAGLRCRVCGKRLTIVKRCVKCGIRVEDVVGQPHYVDIMSWRTTPLHPPSYERVALCEACKRWFDHTVQEAIKELRRLTWAYDFVAEAQQTLIFFNADHMIDFIRANAEVISEPRVDEVHVGDTTWYGIVVYAMLARTKNIVRLLLSNRAIIRKLMQERAKTSG